jgi:hypothetical protein
MDEVTIEVDEDVLAEATDYSIGTDIDSGLLIVRFYQDDDILSSMVLDSAGAHDLARRIMRGYDILEGL